MGPTVKAPKLLRVQLQQQLLLVHVSLFPLLQQQQHDSEESLNVCNSKRVSR